jgi:hypothetical protein
MSWDFYPIIPGYQDEEWPLQEELLELRQAVATALGRHQYAYNLLDTALESGHLESMKRARREFDLLDEDVRSRILDAAGATS